MAELERDLHRQKSGSDLGRARKRKMQRESGILNQAEVKDLARNTNQKRTTRKGGPSTREKMVAEQIKDPADPISELQGKLSSMLGVGKQQSSGRSGTRSRRKEATRLNEPPMEVTRRTDTLWSSNSQNSPIPTKNRRVFDARSESAPPVMVRGGMSGMAFGRVANSRLQKQRAPRRRIDVPLRSTGAEIRLPSIPFIQAGWRSISLLMVIMLSACLFLMWKAPMFQVNAVEADGLKRLTVNDLYAVMGTTGKSVFALDPNALRQALSQAFPEFSKISVRINLPASVKVVVTERQPVIDWTQDGVETWVDGEGVAFPPRGTVETPLVQVEGYGTAPSETPASSAEGAEAPGIPMMQTISKPAMKLSSEMVSAILALGAKMPADTVLVYDSERGLGWNDPNGWEVFFGDENQDMEMKLVVYQALVERLKNDGIQPALISVEYIHAPYYRMER